jgi:hypothetical protein
LNCSRENGAVDFRNFYAEKTNMKRFEEEREH